jgi:hypothetical protein
MAGEKKEWKNTDVDVKVFYTIVYNIWYGMI